MSHLIYSTQTKDFVQGASYANPEYYRGEVQNYEKVTVIGDWPDIVAAYKKAGIDAEVQEVESSPKTSGIGGDSDDQFSDEQLREAITTITGKKPHPNMKRENLIAQFNSLNEKASEQ